MKYETILTIASSTIITGMILMMLGDPLQLPQKMKLTVFGGMTACLAIGFLAGFTSGKGH